jgi:hypothetical protein
MAQNSGTPIIIAAVILGAAVVVGSVMIRSSLDQGTAELAGVRAALSDFPRQLAAAAPPTPSRAARPARPDPNRRYSVNTAGSPAKGPQTAKITIVEFSDFQ